MDQVDKLTFWPGNLFLKSHDLIDNPKIDNLDLNSDWLLNRSNNLL